VHVPEAATLLYDPGGQMEQAPAVGPDQEPAAHGLDELAPAAEEYPAGVGTHVADDVAPRALE
jgi:hypothetical protein